jgi:GDP-4-dehydro-6-deoxy-D-mannose reductase
MRVLIIGITGFAGRYLAAELERSGHDVIGASRRDGDGDGDGARDADGRRLLACDVTQPDQVASALAAARADAVVVLAGIASPPAAQRDPDRAYRVHVLGTVNLLTAARSFPKLRVLLVTSSEAYGQVPAEELPVTEETPLRPASIYAASKASADLAGRAFALSEGMDVVRVRAFNHTGPGQRTDFVCPDFARQVAEIAAGRRSPRMEVGNLEAHRDFTDVRDIVRGYVAALERGRGGEAYNLCSGRATLVKSILEDLCRIADVRPELHVVASRQRRAEVPAYWGSFRKAEAELGWRPEIPWEQTLADLYRDARTRLHAE